MQAIEFESVVQDQAIPLPAPGVLSPGQAVRVVVMFEEKLKDKLIMEKQQKAQQAAEDLIAHEEAYAAMQLDERLATLAPHPEALGDSADDPAYSPWDEAAWHKKWKGAR